MEFEEIKSKVEEYFKNRNLTAKFDDDDDYKNAVSFWAIDENKKVVLPKQKMPISRILEKASLENYLSSLESRLKSG